MPTVTIGNNTGDTYTGFTGGRMAEAVPNTTLMSPSGSTVFTSDSGASDQQHSLLRPSGLSSITGPVTVSSATLRIYQTDGGGATATVAVHRCLQAWTLASTTWNSVDAIAPTSWNTAGATGSGTDIIGTASATLSINTTTGAYFDITSAQLATDVQDWINGVNTNNGWLLLITPETGTGPAKTFSGNTDTDGQRPVLSVTYTSGGSEASVAWIFA